MCYLNLTTDLGSCRKLFKLRSKDQLGFLKLEFDIWTFCNFPLLCSVLFFSIRIFQDQFYIIGLEPDIFCKDVRDPR